MNIKRKIEDRIDVEDVDINIDRYENYTSSIAEKLKNNDIIENEEMTYIKFNIEAVKNIAEVRICSFSNNIQYIQSVEVNNDYRGKGIGSILFKYIINDLIPRNKNTIYIKPTNKAMKFICKKNNFSKCERISSWYKL